MRVQLYDPVTEFSAYSTMQMKARLSFERVELSIEGVARQQSSVA